MEKGKERQLVSKYFTYCLSKFQSACSIPQKKKKKMLQMSCIIINPLLWRTRALADKRKRMFSRIQQKKKELRKKRAHPNNCQVVA